jgi:hypothetical protein
LPSSAKIRLRLPRHDQTDTHNRRPR